MAHFEDTGSSDVASTLNYIWRVDVQRVCLGLGLRIPRGFPHEDQGSDIMTGVIASNFGTVSSLGPLHTHLTGTLRNCQATSNVKTQKFAILLPLLMRISMTKRD